MRNFFWSKRNEKMNKTAKAWTRRFGREARFRSFNIPRLSSETGKKTCPYAGACADICYAGQGRMNFAAARAARERNLAHITSLSQGELTDKLIEDIASMPSVTHIRIHDSGDFFSKRYYRSWVNVANECDEVIFYAYTKSIPFIDWDSHPKNFRLVQSMGGKRDKDIDPNHPHSRIFATEAERKRAGYCDGNISDLPAVLGQKKIGLVYHGVRKLTEGNLVQLRVA